MKIKSKFIRSELKKTKWKDREYIEALIDIEKVALGILRGGRYHNYNLLKEKYPKQWKKIWLELNPKGYKEIIESEKKEEERERKELEEFEKEEKLELKKYKEEWIEMGGKF